MIYNPISIIRCIIGDKAELFGQNILMFMYVDDLFYMWYRISSSLLWCIEIMVSEYATFWYVITSL